MEKFIGSCVGCVIAIGAVFLAAWILNTDPSSIVGWVALGIAAGSRG